MTVPAHNGEILVVEDTPSSLKLLSELLGKAGYAVREAPDGELALWSANARPPELILLDVRMPGIDGFEVCRRLKLSETLRDIPVVFLSAQSDLDDKVRGFAAGAIDFIGKPYQPEEVLARTAAHIALARSQRALAAANAELVSTIAQLEAARAELRRSEKLAALGAMVAGVAHELNTPIGNCLLAATALDERSEAFSVTAAAGLRRSELDSFVGVTREANALLIRNLQSAAALIERFKQVATDQDSLVRRRFDVAQLLDEVAGGLGPRLKARNVRLHIEVAPFTAMDSFPGALSQVVGNLLVNALVHAFPAEMAQGEIRIAAASDGGVLTLRLSDDGSGIGDADLKRVFDPFFTTRMGQGTGLGLHIVYNLVTNVLGGTIEASSRPGDTSFVLRCPCSAPALAGKYASA